MEDIEGLKQVKVGKQIASGKDQRRLPKDIKKIIPRYHFIIL